MRIVIATFLILASLIIGYLLYGDYWPASPVQDNSLSDSAQRLQSLSSGLQATNEVFELPKAENAEDNLDEFDQSLDARLSQQERDIANLQTGEFEYLARQVLSLEDQIVLRDSGHLEIQANIAILMGNATEFEAIPKTDAFLEHQKIAWTYGMDAYRAINFLEQNQYGRLMTWSEIQAELDGPAFEQLKGSFSSDYLDVSDERRSELYERVLSARDDPAVPTYVAPQEEVPSASLP